MDALRTAIEIAGNQTKLAEMLDVTPMTVSHWLKRGRVPPGRCVEIEQITGGRVTRHDLRPDLFEPRNAA